jgi:hypothetical protein
MASLDDLNAVLSVMLTTVTGLAITYVAVKTRLHLDWAMVIISLAYFLSQLFRTPIFEETDLNLIHATASMLIWGSLYFFVFEMKKLEDTLKSESLEENLWRAKRTSRCRAIVFILFLVVIVASANVLYLTKMIDRDTYNEYITAFDVMLAVRCLTKVAIDGYMFTQFIKTFYFFIAMKR